MLSAHYWKNANDTLSYFLTDERNDQVGEPLWAGETIAILKQEKGGWPDAVEVEHLGLLLDGGFLQTPPAAGRNCAADFTFTAPKDVSIFAALADAKQRDAIISVHLQAVLKALGELEGFSAVQVAREVAEGLSPPRGRGRPKADGNENPEKPKKGRGERVKILTKNLPAALFTHFTARPVDGEPDPNIHTHCLVPRITMRPDGGWGTLDVYVQKQDILSVDQTYRKYLFNGLVQKAVPAAVDARYGLVIDGITDDVRRVFSMRSAQIRNHAHGDTESEDLAAQVAKRRKAAIQTRENKSEIPWEDWLPFWRQRALREVASDTLEEMEKISMEPDGRAALEKLVQLVDTQQATTTHKPDSRRR